MRVGSPMRPGKTAEAITPIIVARTTGGQRIGVSGSAARSVWCQETERSTSEGAISTSASTIQPGVAVISAWPMRCRSSRVTASATRPISSTSPRPIAARRSSTRRDRIGGLSDTPIRRGLAGQLLRSRSAAPGSGAASASRRVQAGAGGPAAMLAPAAMRPAP